VWIAPAFLVLVAVLAVPLVYVRFWPVRVGRPRLFLAVALGAGLLLGVAAIVWAVSVLRSVGVGGGSAAPPSLVAAVLRNRFLVAGLFAFVVEYLLCRIIHTVLGQGPGTSRDAT
jgi:hypothetical protein